MESIISTLSVLLGMSLLGNIFVIWLFLHLIREKDTVILTMKMQGAEPDRDILLGNKEKETIDEEVEPDFINPEDMTDEQINNLK